MRLAASLLVLLALPLAARAQRSPHLAQMRQMRGRALACLEAGTRDGALTHVRRSSSVDRWCATGDPCADEPLGAPIAGTRYELRASTSGGADGLELEVRARAPAGAVHLVLQPWTGGVTLVLTLDDGEHMHVGPEQCVDVPDGQLCEGTRTLDASGVEGWHAALVRGHLGSARALRDTTLDVLARLRARVERAVAEHRLTTCGDRDEPGRFVYRPGPGGSRGMFDTCVRRPLTADEEQAALAAARAEIARRERFVERHHRAWHAAIDARFPVARCWL